MIPPGGLSQRCSVAKSGRNWAQRVDQFRNQVGRKPLSQGTRMFAGYGCGCGYGYGYGFRLWGLLGVWHESELFVRVMVDGSLICPGL